MAKHSIQTLSSGWEFKSAFPSSTSSHWLPAQVPSSAHSELLRHKKIADPFVDRNELHCAWVAEETWIYRTEFPTPSPSSDNSEENAAVDLAFEGLDTFATVTLNEEVILQADNMFMSYRVPVGHLLVNTGNNKLEITFHPARDRGLELVKAHPEHDFIVHQTEVSRGPVRKAQCHWGWDWGPILLTCGPWKEVLLERYVVRIGDVRVDYEVDLGGVEEGKGAVVRMGVRAGVVVAGGEGGLKGVEVKVGLWLDGKEAEFGEGKGEWKKGEGEEGGWAYEVKGGEVRDAKLWWPKGYGQQQLYELRVNLIRDGAVLAEKTQNVGFRKVELIQEDDSWGNSFYFRINGVDVFCGGSCWIPADSLLTRLTPEDYRSWITLLAEGNQIMVRIWGGGIYESPAFYTACDELGILVWQDFMFACASYPTYPSFLASVETEARCNLQRIRQHPSVILWCGNNEDYQLIERYNLAYDFPDKDPQSWLKSNFPARYIYEHLLPSLVVAESPSTPYHPGSPWGNGHSTTLKVDPTVGDIHQWSVWHGEMHPYQHLPSLGGRFISEFGMESLPSLSTIRKFITSPSELYPSSATLDFHNKAVGHSRRLMAYITENFRLPASLPELVHTSQIMQADAIAWAYKSWRRQWGTRQCGGVLLWQLNDTWPCTSWSAVDYFLVKKPAWYTIRWALAPVSIGTTRKIHSWTARPADSLWRRETGHLDPLRGVVGDVEFDVWVSSSEVGDGKGRVVVRFVSVESGEEIRGRMEKEIMMKGNGCTEVWAGMKVEFDHSLGPVVIHASLWVGDKQVGSDVSWPEPIKYLSFEERGVKVRAVGGGVVEVSAEKPVKGFVFAERQGLKVSDNGFDLIPGERPTRVRIEGNEEGEIPSWTYIGR